MFFKKSLEQFIAITMAGRKLVLRTAILAATLLLVACDKPQEQGMQAMQVPVSVIQVKPRVAAVTANLPGRVQALEDAQVRARVNGIVKSINFEQGGLVKAGQSLFEIDPAPYAAARDQAKAQLQNAVAAAKTADTLRQRYSKLVKQSAISKQDYDNALAQAQQTAAQVQAAQAALDQAEIDLGYTKVTAPISGRIGKAQVTVGALVSASAASLLATIHSFDQVYVDFTQSVEDMSALRRQVANGQVKPAADDAEEVYLKFNDGSTYKHNGRLMFSGIAVDPGTGQVNLRAIFPNQEELLLPGLYVRVQIKQGTDPEALIVPEQAILRTPDGNSTLVVVKDDKANYIPVQLGPRAEGGYIIYDGIQADDVVVVAGFQKIRPGAPVKALPWNPKQQADQAATDAQPDAADKAQNRSENQ